MTKTTVKYTRNKKNRNKTKKTSTTNRLNKKVSNKKNISNKTLKNKPKKIYTKDDYNSDDGMLTTVWGPSMWHYLHTMSFNYPVKPTIEQKKHYKDFILSLQNVLPCKWCRMNLKNNLKQLPLTQMRMKNRETFSRYIFELHELINTMLGKRSGLTYDDVRERYEHFRSRCTIDITMNKKDIQNMFNKTTSKSNSNYIKPSSKNKTVKRIHIASKYKRNKDTKENGCTEPLYGKKSKCIIKIVPQEDKGQSFQMDSKCMKVKM